MAIITETPGQPTFERRIYAQYAYIMALLEYTNAHAAEMRAVVKQADEETVARVKDRRRVGRAEELSRRRVSLAREDRRARVSRRTSPEYLPGTSVLGTKPGTVERQAGDGDASKI